MDTKHVLEELLAQYDEATAVPAGMDAEEAELVRRVMGARPEARAGDGSRGEQAAQELIGSR